MRQLFFILSFFFISDVSAFVKGVCNVRYKYSVYHEPTPPSYYEGKIIGKTIIDYGTAGYYEYKWTYTTEIVVTGGKELNGLTGTFNYAEKSIYILVIWSNGGETIIEADNLSSNTGIIEKETFKNAGQFFYTGFDDDKNYFEITLTSISN